MHLLSLISLTIVPLLVVGAPAEPAAELDTRAQCPLNPCIYYNTINQYCAAKYTDHVDTLQKLAGTKAISCMCGHEGANNIDQIGTFQVSDGSYAIQVCGQCGLDLDADGEKIWALCKSSFALLVSGFRKRSRIQVLHR